MYLTNPSIWWRSNKLDVEQNKALRIVTGTAKTTPVTVM